MPRNSYETEKKSNKDEEDVVSIVVPYGGELKNGPSDITLTAALIFSMNITDIKEALKERKLLPPEKN